MTTTDTLREQISRETRRGEISSNVALILNAMLDKIDACHAAHKPCPECARRADWATGAKV